jgi:plasmid stability protein
MTGTGRRGEVGRFIPLLLTALSACILACIAYKMCMQYTIRNVPHTLDAALRRAAREQGKSLNEVAIEALARGAGITGEPCRQRDLSDIEALGAKILLSIAPWPRRTPLTKRCGGEAGARHEPLHRPLLGQCNRRRDS